MSEGSSKTEGRGCPQGPGRKTWPQNHPLPFPIALLWEKLNLCECRQTYNTHDLEGQSGQVLTSADQPLCARCEMETALSSARQPDASVSL